MCACVCVCVCVRYYIRSDHRLGDPVGIHLDPHSNELWYKFVFKMNPIHK